MIYTSEVYDGLTLFVIYTSEVYDGFTLRFVLVKYMMVSH